MDNIYDLIDKNLCFGYNSEKQDLCKSECQKNFMYCDKCYYQRNNKDLYTNSTHKCITISKNIVGKENKIKFVKKIFNFALLNKKLVNSLPSYKIAVIKKIKEFTVDDDTFNYYLDEKIWNKNYKSDKQFSKIKTIEIEEPVIINIEHNIIL